MKQAGRGRTFGMVEKVLGGAECCSQSRCCILISAAEAAQWPSIIHTKGRPPPSPSQACAPASPLHPQNVWAVLRGWKGGADPLTGGTHDTPSKFKQRPNRVGPVQSWMGPSPLETKEGEAKRKGTDAEREKWGREARSGERRPHKDRAPPPLRQQ